MNGFRGAFCVAIAAALVAAFIGGEACSEIVTVSDSYIMYLGRTPLRIPAGSSVPILIRVESQVSVRITDPTGQVIFDETFSSKTGEVRAIRPVRLPSTGRYRVEESYFIGGYVAPFQSEPFVLGSYPSFQEELNLKKGRYLLRVRARWYNIYASLKSDDLEATVSASGVKRIIQTTITFPRELPGGHKIYVRTVTSGTLYKDVKFVSGGWMLNREEELLAGDVNLDGRVDAADLQLVTRCYGRSLGDPLFDPSCDLNGDGVIDVKDLVVVARSMTAQPVPAPGFKPPVSVLGQNYPNPFNPETWIPFTLSKPAHVVVTVFDSTGRVVRRLDLGWRESGFYLDRSRAAYWDGRDELGRKVASGVYFYQIKAGDFAATRKMIVVK